MKFCNWISAAEGLNSRQNVTYDEDHTIIRLFTKLDCLNSHDLKRFENEDERGWYAYDQLRKTGSNDRREDRPNMYYPIKNPDGEDLYPTAVAGYDSCWRVEKKTYDKLVEDDYILWKKTYLRDAISGGCGWLAPTIGFLHL